MLQCVDVTDAVIANVQITATLLAATRLDIKDQAMKLGVFGPTAAREDLPKVCSLSAILRLRNHADQPFSDWRILVNK